jgi:hypothetical protein
VLEGRVMNERDLDPPEDDDGLDPGDEIDRAYEDLMDLLFEDHNAMSDYEKLLKRLEK